MAILALMRHGQSLWTRDNRFSGWADISLSPRGREEARCAGRALVASNLTFDLCQTSLLSRANETLGLVLSEMQRPDLEIESSWLLNERHYGSLQGHSRRDVYLRYGNTQVVSWRRDFRAKPPSQETNDPHHPFLDPKYRHIDKSELPSSESLEDAADRALRWWEKGSLLDCCRTRIFLLLRIQQVFAGLSEFLSNLMTSKRKVFALQHAYP